MSLVRETFKLKKQVDKVTFTETFFNCLTEEGVVGDDERVK